MWNAIFPYDTGSVPQSPVFSHGFSAEISQFWGRKVHYDTGTGTSIIVARFVTGGGAARQYERLGWKRVGVIPGDALLPQGGLCGTTVYYRNLDS